MEAQMELLSKSQYQSPFVSRWIQDRKLLELLSDNKKAQLFRQLWVILAEGEHKLGLPEVTAEMVEEMRQNVTNIDWELVAREEARVKHDVMAHVAAFKKVCPKAAGVIHLGATSAFVQDNSDLMIMAQALDDYILPKIASCLHHLGKLAWQHKELPTVGRTHYQHATLITVGKRCCLWAQELLLAFSNLRSFRSQLRFRGIQGATGTQASFLDLFKGDRQKVDALQEFVTKAAGFQSHFVITGQTYTRLQDYGFVEGLSRVAAALHKICMDIRLLQHDGEMAEPFEENQIGSSAMPYKRNPMKCERICGIATHVMSLPQNLLQIAAKAGFERTLDDSANRRIVLPEAILGVDAMLTVFLSVVQGLKVNETRIVEIVDKEAKIIALEHVLMELVKEGKSRQEGHAKIRDLSVQSTEKGAGVDVLMQADPYFATVFPGYKEAIGNPKSLTGLCPQQVAKFLDEELSPEIQGFKIQDAQPLKV